MTTLKIIGIILLILYVAGWAVLYWGNVAKMIDKARIRQAERDNKIKDQENGRN